jgi:hypothetical protein
MSAFLVDKKTIDKILTDLDKAVRIASTWAEKKLETKLGIDCNDPTWKTKLGQRMFDLNQLALEYRYGDQKKELIYKFQTVPCTKVQAFKALQCWIYQCTEGNIPEDSKLYDFFDNVLVPEWAESIAIRTPEYEQAEWG